MNKARQWAPLAAALLFSLSRVSWADDHGCKWDPNVEPGPMTFVHHFGTLYVPRDAQIGAVIGTDRLQVFLNREGAAKAICWWEANKPAPEFTTTLTVPLAPPPANVQGNYDPQRLLETDVPGVAVQVEYNDVLGNNQHFNTLDGSRAIAPQHSAMIHEQTPFPAIYGGGWAWFTAVKTGAIAPGTHQVTSRVLYNGAFTDIGHAFTFAVEGTIVVAQCSVGSNAPVEVNLRDWDKSHFSALGTVTTPVPVTLSLHNCADDPVGGVATVHAHFTPKDGSQIIGDPADGVFSLGNGASAQGVAIRLLKADNSPMPLDTTLPIKKLPPSGPLDLTFAAQIIQTAPTDQVTAGTVEGMLEFTLTYQ